MKPDSDSDRSHESIINDTLARFLRERCGLSAVAETQQAGVQTSSSACLLGL